MRQLANRQLGGCTIIEHRKDGEITGRIEYASINGDGSLGVGWVHHGGGGYNHRTTRFSSRSWRCKIVENFVSLERIDLDIGFSDIPWRDADLYTIILLKK